MLSLWVYFYFSEMIRSKGVLYPLELHLYVSLRAGLRSVGITPSTRGMMPFVTGCLKSSFNLSLKRKKNSSNTFFFIFGAEFKSLSDYTMEGRKKNYIFFPNDNAFSLKSSLSTSHFNIKAWISKFRKDQIGKRGMRQFSVSLLMKLYKILKAFKSLTNNSLA